ncbi:LysR family transcriptional regulator [Pseudorhizobium endolithicum]|uniref:LysR family transcriptional regulator n=1 Tax=Pseudorhizobium endolithicum TaxID=1191678 RepID=A0ABN7JZG9_9HYPH|nr:LysR family transcriptional regulator [Pseudorhizobium endolithicum]CAD7051177.1 LysR family transcriptional regulator [Pseudorhizobium endolithicum]
MAFPPVDLGWLRLFREIARHGSLSAAGRVLGLSQPAVSYQMRQLEAAFGVHLLHRQHRGVALSREGRQLLDVVARSVSDIDTLAERLRQQARRPSVRLATDYAFATLWLIPRMQSFRERHPEIDIQIVSTQRLASDWADQAEIAVAFGSRAEFGHVGRMMMPERVVPVCAPALLERVCRTEDLLATAPLIHLEALASSPWFDWSGYLSGAGIHRPAAAAGGDASFNTYAMVVQAALGGQGLALGWLGLIDSQVTTGMLAKAGPEVAAPDRGYFLMSSRSADRNVRQLADWLLAEAELDEGR